MDTALSELITISNAVGADSSLVQGVGGNTSITTTDGQYTYIKASGTALADMSSAVGWRRLKSESVRAIFQDASMAQLPTNEREAEMVVRLQAACDDQFASDVRPSVESPLHVILDRCMIHLHPLAALAYASAKGGQARIMELFADHPHPPLWVPYADPGYSLGRKAFRLVGGYRKQHGRKPSVIFLQKHGLVVAAGSAASALSLVRKVIVCCELGLPPLAMSVAARPDGEQVRTVRQALTAAIGEFTGEPVTVSHFTDATVSAAMARDDIRKILSPTALTPDEMGFVRGAIVYLPSASAKAIAGKVAAVIARQGKCPTVFMADGVGLFIVAAGRMAPIIRDIVVGSLQVRMHAQDMGGINPLNQRQRRFIENWEAEKFRGDLAGR